jgi:uroporphyrinogen-III synthase
MPWRLLLTRPAEESALLAAELATQGIASASLPLLAIEPLPFTVPQRELMRGLNDFAAVIVVSKPAARLGLELLREVGPATPAPRWFSVGAGTAAVLQQHGFTASYPAAGDDSEALLQLPALQAVLAAPGARVLILRGEGGRELLAERLRGQGVGVEYLQLYRRCLPEYAGGELLRRIRAERLNGVVVSSGQGLQHLQQLAGAHWPQLSGLALFVPSPRVAEQARAAGASIVVDCRGASAQALLAALRDHPQPEL